jgi:tRNA pseudouridine55 synthase
VNSGILLVDKPPHLTSHDVVGRMRRLAGTRRIGHAGTLDPMATGLLILGVNSATRLLHYLVGLDKEYRVTIRLGWGTTTDDAEGEPLPGDGADVAIATVDEETLRVGIRRLTGVIDQVPSSVSAVKVGGQRAYRRVRDGETVELAARTVTVSAFDLLSVRAGDGYLDADVRVECSSGTYVRALARDLGADLGTGGHLTALRRTRIGAFGVDEASVLEGFDVEGSMMSPADAARRALPVVEVTAQQAVDLGHGKCIAVPRLGRGRPDRRDRFRRPARCDRRAPWRDAEGRDGVPRRGGRSMIEWFAWVQIAVAVAGGLLCLALGFAGRVPSDLTNGALALVELLLVAQLVVAIAAPAFGNEATGSVLEFYVYLISALLIPPAAIFWGLVERSRWSTVVLGVAALAVAVMVYRMLQIWTVQQA